MYVWQAIYKLPYCPGAHLRSPRSGYFHHGIYLGTDGVAHFAGNAPGHKASASLRITSLEDFADGNKVEVVPEPGARHGPNEVVYRATTAVSDPATWPAYDVVANNCEHFTTWCLNGAPISKQVRGAVFVGLSIAALALLRGK